MKNDSIVRLLTKSPHEGGCGMSTRPEFYSGLGWSTLDEDRLVKIYRALESQASSRFVHQDAPDHFVQMVLSIPVMSATAFLTEFHRLDANDYYFKPSDATHTGIDLGSDYRDRDMLAQVSVFSALTRQGDPTYLKVRRFLADIGRPKDIKKHPQHKAQMEQQGKVRMNGTYFCPYDNF